MDFAQVFHSYVSNDPNVEAQVSDRIYRTKLPEGATLPAASWRRISATRAYTFDAYEDTRAWVAARIQLDCWAKTQDEADDIATALLLALSGFYGDADGLTISSVGINELDDYEQRTEIYRRTLEFVVSYQEDLEPAS